MNAEPHTHDLVVDNVPGLVWNKWYVKYGTTQVTLGWSRNGMYLSPRLMKRLKEATLRAIRSHDEGSKRAKVLVPAIEAGRMMANELRLVACRGQWASERIAAEKER